MINPEVEINRLRMYLRDRGWYDNEVEDICGLASNDISEIILDVVSNAVADATEYAEGLGAIDFIEDMDVIEIGGGFVITTASGKTDFSKPERHMLPDLLKNGKVSSDGDRYKVIPVGKSRNIQQPKDIFSVLRHQQGEQEEARARLLEKNLENRSERAQHMAGHFRDIISRKLDQVRANKEASRSISKSAVEFRTASDKQDPQTQWVIPAVNMDMTGYLMDVNKRIEDTIRDSIVMIIDSYEKEFA